MQQRFRKVALFVGATSVVSAGLFVVACGTDNGNPVATPSVDGGKTDTGGGKVDGQVDPDIDGAVPEGGVDADCSKNPVLRDNSAGFRCAFKSQDAGPDASPLCTNTQECCNTANAAAGPSYCADGKGGDAVCAAAAAANNSTYVPGTNARAWECADKSACPGTDVCCIISDPAQLAMDPKNTVNFGKTLATDKSHPQACNVARVFKEGGSRCKTACAATGEYKLCSLTDPCGAGTVCTPFVDFTNFVDRGYCK